MYLYSLLLFCIVYSVKLKIGVYYFLDWGKFTEPFKYTVDVLADKPHPRFGMKFVGLKGAAYKYIIIKTK